MATYYKLWFKPGVTANGRPVTAGLYQITSETKHMLSGRRVNAQGDDDSTCGADGIIVETIHVIQKSTIRRRQLWIMNNHYAELEPVTVSERRQKACAR